MIRINAPLSFWQLAIGGAASVGSWLALKALWNLFLSPLARQRIPGPSYAAASNTWFMWHVFRFDRVHRIHELFDKYGPVVRIAPNRVVFKDMEAVQEIYRTHKFRKSDWYASKTIGGNPSSFTTKDPEMYNRFKRWSGPAFRTDNLRGYDQAIQPELNDLVDRIRQDCGDGQFMDAVKLYGWLSLDILGITILGQPLDQIATGQDHRMTKLIDLWIMDKILIVLLPQLIYKCLWRLPIAPLRHIFYADAGICEYAANRYELADDEKDLDKRANLLTAYKTYRDPSTNESVPKHLVLSEVSTFMAAGIDTITTSLTYATYELARSHIIWTTLRTELANSHGERTLEALQNLPYLNAFIRELLRVHTASGFYLERVVPDGGAMLSGYFIPAGTIVGAQSLSIHRDASLFPEAECLKPERWVRQRADGSWNRREDISSAQEAAWIPFSLGVRICPGRHLAELELLRVITTVVSNFRIHLHASATPESMKEIDMSILRPRAGRCLVYFEYDPIT